MHRKHKMSASSTKHKTKESINNIFADIKNAKASKKHPTSKEIKAKKVAKRGKKCFFCNNYGNFSLISFGH